MINDPSAIEKKIEQIKELFFGRSSEEKIQSLLNLGRLLPPYANELKIPTRQVVGCQSILYLSSHLENGKVIFNASADALISGGMAAILISVYSGEAPKTILNTSPNFLIDFGILSSLTPTRSNGLAHIHQRMKKDALNFLLSTMKSIELNPTSL
jgi:cysteine desulfuration protein SufE